MEDIKKLLDGWNKVLEEYAAYPYKDGGYVGVIAERGMSWSAHFVAIYSKDPLLEEIHYNFGLLEVQNGKEADKLWSEQARLIKEAARKYGITK